MKNIIVLLVFCAGILFFQPVVAQSQDSISETTVQQVESTVNKGNSNVLLTQIGRASCRETL